MMQKVIMQRVGWLDWRFVAGGLAVIIGLAVCDKLPTLGIVAGAAPLLLIAACLVPCLLPLALLRRARRGQRTNERVSGNE
jgi:O-antigen ligase